MLYLSFDLEMNQPSRKIIQIGACVCNFERGFIVDELRININPNETLNPSIAKLTGLKDSQVSKGLPLSEGFEKLAALHAKYACSPGLITWGGKDPDELRMQLDRTKYAYQWPFGFEWLDVKTLYFGYALARGLPTQGGLATTMRSLDLEFAGRSHDALDDAKNTFILAHYLIMSGARRPARKA